jgi:hypothetical protein
MKAFNLQVDAKYLRRDLCNICNRPKRKRYFQS